MHRIIISGYIPKFRCQAWEKVSFSRRSVGIRFVISSQKGDHGAFRRLFSLGGKVSPPFSAWASGALPELSAARPAARFFRIRRDPPPGADAGNFPHPERTAYLKVALSPRRTSVPRGNCSSLSVCRAGKMRWFFLYMASAQRHLPLG